MSEEQIRDGLVGMAEPMPPPPGATASLMTQLERRRRRRGVVVVAGAVTAIVAIGVGVTALRGGTEADAPPVVDRTDTVAAGDWQEVAASPLAPRNDAVGVWTGAEMVVVGGTTNPPCPPLADCASPPEDTLRRDGAAYDPTGDTWRPIAPAPTSITNAIAVWSGSEMVVVTATGALAYDPEADAWRTLATPPRTEDPTLLATDLGIVLSSYSKRPGRPADHLLDRETGAWVPLPEDPFGESYDRSLAWDGERLWLLSMAVENHFDAVEGAPSRLAVLEDGSWRVVEEATPDLGYGQRLWWWQDRLVVPATPSRDDGIFRLPDGAEWQRIPTTDAGAFTNDGYVDCELPRAGVGESWLASGGPVLTSVDPLSTLVVPRCPQLAVPDVAVWAGDELLLWGGAGGDYRSNVNVGLRWSPPDPG